VLKSLHLADGFRDVSAHGWSQNLDGLNNHVWVNDEAATHLNASILIVYAVDLADVACCIRGHMPRDPAINRLGQ